MGDLQEAIARLLKKREAGWLFDRIILETTGMADPAPIIQSLVLDKISAPKVILESTNIVVLESVPLEKLKEYQFNK